MPHSGIQGILLVNWNAAVAPLNAHHNGAETTNSTRAIQNAVYLARCSGPNSTTNIPTRGKKTRKWITQLEYPIAPRNPAIRLPCYHEADKYEQHAHHQHECVGVELPRLQSRTHPAKATRELAHAVYRAIDETVIDEAPEQA